MLTKEQLAERINYIGASDAAAVLGMSRWSSPLKVWAEKTGLIPPQDLSDNLAVELGSELEDFVAKRFTKITGKSVSVEPATVYHPSHKFIAANLDRRVVDENAVLECKTASAYKAKEWEGEEFPVEYVLQVMHQLAVTGADLGYIAVLIGNSDFKVKTIEREEKALSDLIKREVEFWTKYVLPKVPPSVNSRDKDTLDALYPKAVIEEPIALDDRANMMAESLEGLLSDYGSLGNQIEKQKNELKALLGKAQRGTTGIWEFRWSNVPATKIEAFEKKAYRKFTFKRNGEEK